MGLEFATIDFETTGFSTRVDRVVEIGIVRTSADGGLIQEFSTLVNPRRDISNSSIHGITPTMVRNAPLFEEIAGEVASVLNGAILVAHNASFDARFLASELNRLRCDFSEVEYLCTLSLMYQRFPGGPRKLVECCKVCDVEIRKAHSALDDAQMTSHLLHHLLRVEPLVGIPSEVQIDLPRSAGSRAISRTVAADESEREQTYLSSLIQKMPNNSGEIQASAVSVAEYLNLLDEALQDRKIIPSEAEGLAGFAADVGLSSEQLASLHAAYVSNMCAVAKRDKVITPFEFEDLAKVAKMLGVSDWTPLLDVDGKGLEFELSSSGALEVGTSVCFTGQMSVSREELERRSLGAGLVVKSGVSRALDFLIVADADSTSTKARRARELGSEVLAESVFLRLLEDLEAAGK